MSTFMNIWLLVGMFSVSILFISMYKTYDRVTGIFFNDTLLFMFGLLGGFFTFVFLCMSWILGSRLLKEDEKMFSGITDSVEKSMEESHKIRFCYEPTYDEIKKYYRMYLNKKKADDQNEWTTEEPLSLEEYLDRFVGNDLYGNNLFWYLVAMKYDMFMGGGTMIQFGDY